MAVILITGSGGFIGRHAKQAFERAGHDVLGWRDVATGRGFDPDIPYGEDIEAIVQAAQADCFVHCAWVTDHGAYWQSHENLNWLKATLGLGKAFWEGGARHFIQLGTCAEYDWRIAPMVESMGERKDAPHTLYGQAKLAAFSGLQDIAARHDPGLVTDARIFSPIGPGEDPRRIFPSIIQAAKEGGSLDLTDCTQLRDFLAVEDIADALVHCFDHQLDDVVNIVEGKARPIREAVDLLTDALGNKDCVNIGARPSPIGDAPAIWAPPGKLHTSGWQPKISLANALEGLVDD